MNYKNTPDIIIAKYNLFMIDGELCVPEGVDLGSLCDDFASIDLPVVVVCGEQFDYIVPECTLPNNFGD